MLRTSLTDVAALAQLNNTICNAATEPPIRSFSNQKKEVNFHVQIKAWYWNQVSKHALQCSVSAIYTESKQNQCLYFDFSVALFVHPLHKKR